MTTVLVVLAIVYGLGSLVWFGICMSIWLEDHPGQRRDSARMLLATPIWLFYFIFLLYVDATTPEPGEWKKR